MSAVNKCSSASRHVYIISVPPLPKPYPTSSHPAKAIPQMVYKTPMLPPPTKARRHINKDGCTGREHRWRELGVKWVKGNHVETGGRAARTDEEPGPGATKTDGSIKTSLTTRSRHELLLLLLLTRVPVARVLSYGACSARWRLLKQRRPSVHQLHHEKEQM